MAKVHSIIRRLLVICVLLGLAAQPLNARAFDADDTSYQLTQPDTINTDWENYQGIPDSFELAAENTTFQLYMNAATLAFKVVDKRSGYVWHSNLDEKGEEDRLNRTWTAFAQSGISIDYLDQGAISERASITN